MYSDEEKNKVLGSDADLVEVESEAGDLPAQAGDAAPAAEEETEETKVKSKKFRIQRYKGLGEMNPEELWETTMDPARRILKQVDITDAADADRIFDILMGEDVPSRKSFIQSNAKKATLDI